MQYPWCLNELAKEKWTPVVKKTGEVRQLRKGDGTIEPIISSDKDLSLASARDIKYNNNIDRTGRLTTAFNRFL